MRIIKLNGRYATNNSCIVFNRCYTYAKMVIILSKKEKILEKLLARPNDFTFQETETLFEHYGYFKTIGSKAGGSRVSFTNDSGDYIRLYKPHPSNVLKQYQIDDVITALSERGLL